MLTDSLDGIAARALKQFTRIGALMDPIADKLMGLSALGLLTWSRKLPLWLLVLVIFREVCIFSAVALLDRSHRTYEIRPTRFGKYSTFFLAVTTVFALVQSVREFSGPMLMALSLVTAECVVVSWAQYLARFVGLMRVRRA